MQNTSAVRKIKLLVAVNPPALFPVIEHLLHGRPDFELVESPRGVRQFRDLIVVKRQSPKSKLILFCPAKGPDQPARKCAAEACLDEELVAGRVLKMARELSATHP